MDIYLNRKRCTGCGACINVCPVSAISMREDEKGFLYPVVDDTKCIHCEKCRRTCPTYDKSNELEKRVVYSFTHPDKTILMNSSSGGAFSYICEIIQKKGGYISGPIFDGIRLKHVVTNDPDLISKMKGSKYLQSDPSLVFCRIKELLENGEYVLFSGTPCQVVGLKKYLSKEYEKLLTVDNVCHSIPSPRIFQDYISMLEKNQKDIFVDINFRDKEKGWDEYGLRIRFQTSEIFSPHHGNLYMEGFLDGLYIRASCSDCLVKKNTGYYSDITLGDFWRIRDIDEKKYDPNGVSAVIINTEKGAKLIDGCSLFFKESFDAFAKNNQAYLKCAFDSNNADSFWENYMKFGLKSAYKKAYKVPLTIRVKTIIKNLLK